jgi:hypothetical protein
MTKYVTHIASMVYSAVFVEQCDHQLNQLYYAKKKKKQNMFFISLVCVCVVTTLVRWQCIV